MILLKAEHYTPKQINSAGISVNQDGKRRTLYQVLSFPNVAFEDLLGLDSGLESVDTETRNQLERDALYENYIQRQKRDVEAMQRDEMHGIPRGFDYSAINGLSNELKSKLEQVRPENLSQASRIDGMTPAALTLLLAKLRQSLREKSA